MQDAQDLFAGTDNRRPGDRIKHVLTFPGLSLAARTVVAYIAFFAGPNGWRLKLADLADGLAVDIRTVRRAVSAARDVGLLIIEECPGQESVYRIASTPDTTGSPTDCVRPDISVLHPGQKCPPTPDTYDRPPRTEVSALSIKQPDSTGTVPEEPDLPARAGGGARAREAEAIDIWNAMAAEVGLSRAQKLTSARRNSLKRRLADCGGLDGWRECCRRVADDDWLSGRDPKSDGWRCDIDFVLRETQFVRIMERAPRTASSGRGAAGLADEVAALRRQREQQRHDEERTIDQ